MSAFKKVDTSALMVDPAYQRDLDEKRVKKIVENFDPRLLGALEVSQRNGSDGPFAVFDGQHRLAALKELGHDKAPCLVHKELGIAGEAMLFVNLQQERRSLSLLDRFKARLTAGDPVAADIKRIVERHGYRIQDNGKPGTIGAVGALDRIYKRRNGAELLDRALGLLERWYGDPKATDGFFIEGLAIVVLKHGRKPDFDKKMERAFEVSPQVFIRRAIALLEGGGGTGSRGAAIARQVALHCKFRDS